MATNGIRHQAFLLPTLTLSVVLLAACGSSGNAVERKMGKIAGRVEQVLHHGAYNPDGPNQTITPLGKVRLIVSDTTGTVIDTLITDGDGTFATELAAGTYVISPEERTDKFVPGSSPSPERISLRAGETATIQFRYQVYAP